MINGHVVKVVRVEGNAIIEIDGLIIGCIKDFHINISANKESAGPETTVSLEFYTDNISFETYSSQDEWKHWREKQAYNQRLDNDEKAHKEAIKNVL